MDTDSGVFVGAIRSGGWVKSGGADAELPQDRVRSYLLVSSAKGVVQVDYALEFAESVGYFRKLCLKEVLLGCEHLEVVRVSVLHQQLCIPYCSLEIHDLFLVKIDSLF